MTEYLFDLIRTGGPITTTDLTNEVATLLRVGADPSLSPSRVPEVLRELLRAGRIVSGPAGWSAVVRPIVVESQGELFGW